MKKLFQIGVLSMGIFIMVAGFSSIAEASRSDLHDKPENCVSSYEGKECGVPGSSTTTVDCSHGSTTTIEGGSTTTTEHESTTTTEEESTTTTEPESTTTTEPEVTTTTEPESTTTTISESTTTTNSSVAIIDAASVSRPPSSSLPVTGIDLSGWVGVALALILLGLIIVAINAKYRKS